MFDHRELNKMSARVGGNPRCEPQPGITESMKKPPLGPQEDPSLCRPCGTVQMFEQKSCLIDGDLALALYG